MQLKLPAPVTSFRFIYLSCFFFTLEIFEKFYSILLALKRLRQAAQQVKMFTQLPTIRIWIRIQYCAKCPTEINKVFSELVQVVDVIGLDICA